MLPPEMKIFESVGLLVSHSIADEVSDVVICTLVICGSVLPVESGVLVTWGVTVGTTTAVGVVDCVADVSSVKETRRLTKAPAGTPGAA